LDSLAAAAAFCMGEGSEQTPLVVITENDKIVFQNTPPTIEELKALSISIEEDLYAPLLNSVSWKSQKYDFSKVKSE